MIDFMPAILKDCRMRNKLSTGCCITQNKQKQHIYACMISVLSYDLYNIETRTRIPLAKKKKKNEDRTLLYFSALKRFCVKRKS